MEKWADLCFTWEVAQAVSTSDRRGITFPRFSIVSPRTNGCRGIATFQLLGVNQHLQQLRHEWTQKPLWTLAPLTFWANNSEGSLPSLQHRRKVTPAVLCSTLEQWSSENTACTKHPPEITESGELLERPWFPAFSELWANRILFLQVLCGSTCRSLFPLEGCSHWHSGKGTAGPAPWHVELWECCHLHCVSRNVIMAEQVNYLPPLLSPLIILY